MIDTAGTMNYSSVIPLSPSTKTSLLTNSAWIRDNTRADIDYLYIHSGSTQRIVDEYNATVPRSIDTLISDALCPEPAGTIPTVKKVYWISLIPYTIYLDKCRESTLLAFASYTGSTTNATNLTLGVASPLILSGSTIRAGGTGSITLEGYSITATGQYISYVT